MSCMKRAWQGERFVNYFHCKFIFKAVFILNLSLRLGAWLVTWDVSTDPRLRQWFNAYDSTFCSHGVITPGAHPASHRWPERLCSDLTANHSVPHLTAITRYFRRDWVKGVSSLFSERQCLPFRIEEGLRSHRQGKSKKTTSKSWPQLRGQLGCWCDLPGQEWRLGWIKAGSGSVRHSWEQVEGKYTQKLILQAYPQWIEISEFSSIACNSPCYRKIPAPI